MRPAARRRLVRSHRLLGLVATIPLVGWVASSFVLHGVGLTLPNGLQGVYELQATHVEGAPLGSPSLLPPAAILERLALDGLERIYWLRLETLGGEPAYTVKPGPFELERVYHGATGERLDPLPDELLRRIGEGELVGTHVKALHAGDEFNRYYAMAEVPAVSLEMEGEQPSELVLSRASGRTLRRTDPLAAAFEKAYRSVHVWQWGPSVRWFTAILYTLVGLTLTLATLGYVLWFDRRAARRRWGEGVRPARRVHARLAPVAGVILSTQMLVGAYLWFNLALIEPRFRGQGSFADPWGGGIAVSESLAPPSEILEHLPREVRERSPAVQRVEWRAIGDRRFWIAYPRRDAEGILLEAGSGRALDRLTPELARQAGEMVVRGTAAGPAEESEEYWMDFNARIPTYRLRFTDPDESDVHVSQSTGEVIQRRPAIWRGFGPFLTYHTFGFTGSPVWNTILLTGLQAVVIAMVVSGWRLAFPGGIFSRPSRAIVQDPERVRLPAERS